MIFSTTSKRKPLINSSFAKELLIKGFLLDVVEKITDEEIKELIKNMIGLN